MRERNPIGKKRRAGFTIVELLTVLAIFSILAALAIPAYARLTRRSKISEATGNLSGMFRNAAAYYKRNQNEKTDTEKVKTACRLSRTSWMPGPDPYSFTQKSEITRERKYDSWRAVGMGDPKRSYYYSYRIWTRYIASACNLDSNDPAVYTFRARGDLDGDNVNSMFELPAGSNERNELTHARGIYIVDEFE